MMTIFTIPVQLMFFIVIIAAIITGSSVNSMYCDRPAKVYFNPRQDLQVDLKVSAPTLYHNAEKGTFNDQPVLTINVCNDAMPLIGDSFCCEGSHNIFGYLCNQCIANKMGYSTDDMFIHKWGRYVDFIGSRQL